VLNADGDVAKSTNHGGTWSGEEDSGAGSGHTIAVKPEGNILVGPSDADDKVAYSTDGGDTWDKTGKVGSDFSLVHVAFDSYFDTNMTIYAAGWNGVKRWVIDESSSWKDLKAEPYESDIGASLDSDCGGDDIIPVDDKLEVQFNGIVLDTAAGNPMTSAATGGVLYAAYCFTCDGELYTGVARNLNPASTPCCEEESWDWLIEGLSQGTDGDECFGTEPSSLRICGCLTADTNSILWALDHDCYQLSDGKDGSVWQYEDCLAKAGVDLVSPKDKADIDCLACPEYCYSEPITLKWDRLCTACSYDLEVSLDDDFTELVVDEYVEPEVGEEPSFLIEGLTCGLTYYWRVRVADAESDELIRSWWSETRSFTIAAPTGYGVQLISPRIGETGLPVGGAAFSWTSVSDTSSYNFVLSKNADLSAPILSKSLLTGTALAYAETLDYSTAYYWQVTALKGTNVLSTSAIGTFTTMAEPEEAPPPVVIPPAPQPPAPITPAFIWAIIGIGAVLIIVVIILIVRTRRTV
jgi:hypothetical protein